MKKIRNNKGFTLVELLAVIVVLAIVMGLAVVGITSVLDNTRKSAFLADARSFLAGAHNMVQSDEANKILGVTDSVGPDCYSTDTSKLTSEINLADIILEGGKKGTEQKSPYGNLYLATSKISITADPSDNCRLTYKIYLTDGVYNIGSASALESESSLDANKVIKVGS